MRSEDEIWEELCDLGEWIEGMEFTGVVLDPRIYDVYDTLDEEWTMSTLLSYSDYGY